MKRRHFLKDSFAASAALAAGSGLIGSAVSGNRIARAAAAGADGPRFTFCTFTKSLQHLDYPALAERISALGFDGIEAPIRPQGHIEPAAVEDELPKMVAALAAKDLEITVLTSGINEVSDEQRTEAVLRTAASLGIERFRMGYYRYDLDRPIRPQLDEFRPKLRDLVAACKEIGIKPVYQNHSGANYFGAPLWDLAEVLEDYDPADVGIAFDIGHATTEGSKCWPLHWALCREYVDCVYVKEPHWTEPGRPPRVGPLGEGGIDQGFYKTLLSSDFSGPISLHVEYFDHRKPELEQPFLEATEKDFATLKGFLGLS